MTYSRLATLNQYILFTGPELWRELPKELINKPSLDSFTRAYRIYLGYNYNNVNNDNNNSTNTNINQ